MRLEDHKELITGGSAGIGLALAGAFREAGCEVAICGRDPNRLNAAANEVDATPLRADIPNPMDLASLPSAVEHALVGTSILVNDAGVQFSYDFTSTPSSETASLVERKVRINLEAPAILVGLGRGDSGWH